jgi:hypothetical protein
LNDSTLNWRKSTYSSQGNCVEVADHDDTVLVRDTRTRGVGPVNSYTPSEWRAFLTTLRTAG